MQSAWEFLVLLAVAAFFAGPILALVALARISGLRAQAEQVRRLTSRIFELERRLAAIDRKLQPTATPPQGTSSPVAEPAPEDLPLRVQTAEMAVASSQISQPSTQPLTPPDVLQDKRSVQPSAPPQKPPSIAAPLRTFPASATDRSPADVESILGGKWLYYVGILALAFAVAFFLKYAFDNDWIGPAARVGIGIVIGGAMFPLSDWLVHRSYRYFAEGIAGLGAAVLYLSIWSGWHY